MKIAHFLSYIIAVTFCTQNLHAQDSSDSYTPKTVFVEEMIGNKKQFFQVIVNKAILENKRIGLLSISSYATNYKDNLENNEYQNTTLIYHQIVKGVSINSGTSFTSIEGLKNFVGLQYVYQNRTLSIIYVPSYYFINSNKISNLAIIEYKPAINENWSIYSRIQLHYNHNFENGNHFRSYAYSRLGLTYKYLGFGLAHNFDSYGADKNTTNNFGVFLRLTL